MFICSLPAIFTAPCSLFIQISYEFGAFFWVQHPDKVNCCKTTESRRHFGEVQGNRNTGEGGNPIYNPRFCQQEQQLVHCPSLGGHLGRVLWHLGTALLQPSLVGLSTTWFIVHLLTTAATLGPSKPRPENNLLVIYKKWDFQKVVLTAFATGG